jgi:hypothetical protein
MCPGTGFHSAAFAEKTPMQRPAIVISLDFIVSIFFGFLEVGDATARHLTRQILSGPTGSGNKRRIRNSMVYTAARGGDVSFFLSPNKIF